ncbi:hypothetical protein MTO96_008021 [Rhipicephalus appendiculatus]
MGRKLEQDCGVRRVVGADGVSRIWRREDVAMQEEPADCYEGCIELCHPDPPEFLFPAAAPGEIKEAKNDIHIANTRESGVWQNRQQPGDSQRKTEAQTVTALEGSQVKLSCDISAPGVGDFPVRIRWFDFGPNPVYSVNVNPRTESLSQICQRAQRSSLQDRAYFSVIQTPAVLSVDRLRHADNGSYVCAVYFKKDWTRKLVTHLIIIEADKTTANALETRYVVPF